MFFKFNTYTHIPGSILIAFYFSDNGKVLEYSRSTSPNSSVTILAGSLASNQTYQFKVLMTNRVDSSFQADGYVLVNIQDSDSQLIEVG